MLFQLVFFFIILSGIIILFTRQLARSGKNLADLSPFTGHFISFTLLALVTSMPELVMSISSVTLIGDPNLCAGNIFGSNLLNLSIIAGIEIFLCRGRFISNIHSSSRPLILKQFILGSIPLWFILLPCIDILLFRISAGSVLIIIGYAVFTRHVPQEEIIKEKQKECSLSLKKVLLQFSFQATILILCAIQLTRLCDQISELTGLGNSFLGALLLAGVSSLPEIVLCFSLVRMNQSAMALGNILGSNFFNLTIFCVADFFIAGSLFRQFSVVHVIPMFFVGLITLILLFSIGKSKNTAYTSGWIILLCYLAAMYLLYLFA